MLYVKLIVTHFGHTPKRKNISPAFLCQGRFAGIIGQLTPSPMDHRKKSNGNSIGYT